MQNTNETKAKTAQEVKDALSAFKSKLWNAGNLKSNQSTASEVKNAQLISLGSSKIV